MVGLPDAAGHAVATLAKAATRGSGSAVNPIIFGKKDVTLLIWPETIAEAVAVHLFALLSKLTTSEGVERGKRRPARGSDARVHQWGQAHFAARDLAIEVL